MGSSKSMSLYRIITFFALTGFSLGIKSQVVTDDVYTPFVNFTTKDGLSHNQINDLYQDCYGYLWVATENGLNRFDGYSFVVFRNNPDDSTSISGDEVTSLAGDDKGNLWVGTTEGLNFYHRRSNRFIRYSSNIYNPNSIRSNHIRKVLLIGQEQLWIETVDGTLSRLNLKNGFFDHYTHQPVSQPYYRYHTLYMDRKENLWIGGRNLGVTMFSPKDRQFTTYEANPNDPRKKRDNDLAAIIHTSGGKYYAGGIDGFYAFDPATGNFEKQYASSTFSLAELPEGQILMGTGNGLVIYNPLMMAFTRYRNSIDNPKSVVGNHVNRVLVDRHRNIWVGTEEGLSLLRSNEPAVRQFFHIPGNQTTLSGNDVTSILKDSKGRVWIGTRSNGLNLWDTVQNTFEHFRHDAQNPNSIASDNIRRIYEDRSGNLWVALWSGVGFNRFDPEKKRFTRYALDFNSRKRDWYNDILEDSRGNLWMGIWGGAGIQRFDRFKGVFVDEHFRSGHVPINQFVLGMVDDGCGNLFVQTTIPVIYRYQIGEESFAAHVGAEKRFGKDSLAYRFFSCNLPVPFDTLRAMATNRQGVTLFVTNRGVIKFHAQAARFTLLRGIPDTILQTVYDAANDCFWLFSPKYLYRFNDVTDAIAIKIRPHSISQLQRAIVRCDGAGWVWFLVNGTISLYSPANGQYCSLKVSTELGRVKQADVVQLENGIVISTPSGMFSINSTTRSLSRIGMYPNDSVFLSGVTGISKCNGNSILVVSKYGFSLLDLKGSLLRRLRLRSIPSGFGYSIDAITSVGDRAFISSNRSIFELNLTDGSFGQVNVPDRRMVSSRLTTCILEDGEGYIWIGSSDNGLSRYNPRNYLFDHFLSGREPRSLPSEEVTCLYRDAKNQVWIGTNYGLCRFNRVDSTITMIDNDLLRTRIQSIIEWPDSALWIGTHSGLIRYDLQSGETSLLNESDGLPSTTFNRGVCRLSPSRLALATDYGVITFNPYTLRARQAPGPVSIAELRVFDRVVSYGLQHNDTITLRYSENSITICFTSLQFDQLNANQYSFTISGMDNHWVNTPSNFASFANLDPGRYIFSVTRKGFENNPDRHTRLNLIITPPFWRTAWFWSIIVFVLLSIGVYIMVSYIRQLKISERNVLLEQKLLASQMNPHFIFNSLSAIQSFMYNNEAEEAGNYLASFSRLVRLILENSRSEWIPIDREVQTLKLYLNLQQLRFTGKFDYAVNVDPRINTTICHIPPMLAQPFIENSIEHGIMHKKGKGNIEVTFTLADGLIRIDVVDDGVGLEQSAIINRNREKHTSFATSITRERLEKMKRRGNRNVGITISSRNQTEGNSGVMVTLYVPYKLIIANDSKETGNVTDPNNRVV